jgi:hypothetical protein
MTTSNLVLHPLVCINKAVLGVGYQAFFPNVLYIPVHNYYSFFAQNAEDVSVFLAVSSVSEKTSWISIKFHIGGLE